VAAERLSCRPLGKSMRKMPEPWNPDAHALVVDQVGELLSGPLGGFSWTAAEVLPAPVLPAPVLPVPGSDEQAASSITAAAATASSAMRPSHLGSADLSFIQFIVCPSWKIHLRYRPERKDPDRDQPMPTPERPP